MGSGPTVLYLIVSSTPPGTVDTRTRNCRHAPRPAGSRPAPRGVRLRLRVSRQAPAPGVRGERGSRVHGRSRPSGRLAPRHRLPRVFPRGTSCSLVKSATSDPSAQQNRKHGRLRARTPNNSPHNPHLGAEKCGYTTFREGKRSHADPGQGVAWLATRGNSRQRPVLRVGPARRVRRYFPVI